MAEMGSLLGGFMAFIGLMVGIVGVAVSFIGVAVEAGPSRMATSR